MAHYIKCGHHPEWGLRGLWVPIGGFHLQRKYAGKQVAGLPRVSQKKKRNAYSLALLLPSVKHGGPHRFYAIRSIFWVNVLDLRAVKPPEKLRNFKVLRTAPIQPFPPYSCLQVKQPNAEAT